MAPTSGCTQRSLKKPIKSKITKIKISINVKIKIEDLRIYILIKPNNSEIQAHVGITEALIVF